MTTSHGPDRSRVTMILNMILNIIALAGGLYLLISGIVESIWPLAVLGGLILAVLIGIWILEVRQYKRKGRP